MSCPKYAKVPSSIYVRPHLGAFKYKSDDILIGELGHFTADRAPNWDPFVVVWVAENRRTIGVIFPVIFRVDNRLKFGQDCMSWNPNLHYQCTCPSPSQGEDFGCNCGASDQRDEAHRELYQEAPRDTLYEVAQFPLLQGWVYIWRGNSGTIPCLPITDYQRDDFAKSCLVDVKREKCVCANAFFACDKCR
jgi:hypothetical protein